MMSGGRESNIENNVPSLGFLFIDMGGGAGKDEGNMSNFNFSPKLLYLSL